jgi:hypothetical protein
MAKRAGSLIGTRLMTESDDLKHDGCETPVMDKVQQIHSVRGPSRRPPSWVDLQRVAGATVCASMYKGQKLHDLAQILPGNFFEDSTATQQCVLE